MESKTKILPHTQQSYTDFTAAAFGKGRLHSQLIYEQFMRTGSIDRDHPAFHTGKKLVDQIVDITDCSLPAISSSKTDGATIKFLTKTSEGLEVESVVIPMQSGGTLCVSSQVGCRMGCSFCETGKMGLLKNLPPESIVAQLFIAKHLIKAKIRNVVFMGMGEPLDNYSSVMQAIKIMMDPGGFGFGKRHITLSTSGCVEGIHKLMEEGEYTPNLAVSINAPADELRNKLMPVNKKHNMGELYQTMKLYNEKTNREILIAYVLLGGLNDTLSHAEQLGEYLRGLRVKVNLIPYNPQSRDRYKAPSPDALEHFMRKLRELGYYTLLRRTKGQEIMAACGQLGNLELRRQLFSFPRKEKSV